MTTKFRYLIYFDNGELIGINNSNCLEHFGVPGMKWGVRKVANTINKVRSWRANSKIKNFKGPYTERSDILQGRIKDPGPRRTKDFKLLSNKNKLILADIYQKQIKNYEDIKPNTPVSYMLSEIGKWENTEISILGKTLYSRVKRHKESPEIEKLRKKLIALQEYS